MSWHINYPARHLASSKDWINVYFRLLISPSLIKPNAYIETKYVINKYIETKCYNKMSQIETDLQLMPKLKNSLAGT